MFEVKTTRVDTYLGVKTLYFNIWRKTSNVEAGHCQSSEPCSGNSHSTLKQPTVLMVM